MSNFFDKEKYVVHYKNLQLYLKLGLGTKKLHCILEINQPQWLKAYIEFNTQKGIEAERMEKKIEKRCTELWIMLYTGNNGKPMKHNQCKTSRQ